MLLLDTHMHSTVSFDGSNTRGEMVCASRRAGLDVICFTDHYDVINEKNELVPHYDWRPAREQQMQAQNQNTIGSLPKFLYGLELGNAPAAFASAGEALGEPGLDFVIGSIHNCSLVLDGQDFYYVDYRGRPELADLHLRDYFASMLALARWGNYDTLGHLPYPLRYMRARDRLPIRLEQYREECRELLRINAAAGKAVEVNTNRGRDSLEDYRLLLADWKELGGEYVTVGADAHRTEDVGKGIQKAYQLLRDCGFSYVTYYEQRKPVPVKLS